MANRELSCRLIDETDQVIGEIPDFISVQVQDQLNDECAWKMEYARNGLRATQLIQDSTLYVQFFLGGTKLDFEGVIEQDSWDEVDEADYITLAGRGHVGQLEYATVYPKNGIGTKPAEWGFTNATPGKIFIDLLNAAQARGALPGFSVNFTATHDSSGNAWASTITLVYKAGVNLLDILKNFSAGGYADFRMNGKQLRMYNPRTTLGGESGAVFRRGRDIASAPRSRDRRSIGTSWLIEGDEGVTVDRTDATAVAARGRKERYLSQGGTKDTGTLAVVGDTQLLVYKNARVQKTHNLKFDPEGTSPIPWLNYKPGQYVDTDLTGTLENYRLVSMNITMGSAGVLEGEVTLNDLFAERQLLLDAALNNLTGGSSGGGVSTQPPTQTPPEDTTIPEAPTGLGATSSQYDFPLGVKYSQATATWTAVTQNTDGSVYSDHDYYEFQWWYTENASLKYQLTTPTNTVSWSSLRPGEEIGFDVRAVDVNGHRSAYSAEFEIVTADDTTPPPKPSDPIVSNWLSTLRIEWDGLGDAGEVMPLDFRYVEVWYSTSAAFVPGDVGSVLYDYLPAKGAAIVSGLAYGTPYYVRFIAVDTNGNRSTVSDVASASTKQVVSTDIAGNVIDFSNIRFKDIGNLVPDGSFEFATTAEIINTAQFDVVTNPLGATAAPSPKVLRVKTGSSTYTVTSGITVSADEKYAMIFSYMGVGLAGGDTVKLRLLFTLRDGTTTAVDYKTFNSTTNGVVFTIREAVYNSVPANAVSMDVQIVDAITTGGAFLYLDEWEVRQQTGTVLIADAAITNALIADLAVNNAKIANVSAGKLTVGTLTADITVSARIKTADTGARAELNSAGLGLWNSSNVQTVAFASVDGSAYMQGQVTSGTAGQRLVLNPTTTLFPEIRLYPNTGSNYSFINSFTSGTNSYFGANSGQFTQSLNSVVSHNRLVLTGSDGAILEMVRSSDQVQNGGRLALGESVIRMDLKNTGDATKTGYLEIGRTHLQIGVLAATDTNDCVLFFNSADGTLNFHGAWDNYLVADNDEGIFTGSILQGASTSMIITYGPTMSSSMVPIVNCAAGNFGTATPTVWGVQNQGTATFTVAWNNSQGMRVNFWCYRV